MDWIVYGDGWDFTSEDGGPGDVPAFGLLGIAQLDPVSGYELLRGRTYFVWTEARGWDCHDMTGLIDRLAHEPGCVVRFGRSVPSSRYRQELVERAASDDRLPRKSATSPKETGPGERVD